ncbi:helix-turn-helix transcriptional regulator [Maioricimonas sp. JC845]|uniref:helix-turn-helix domain-containing protein n=1 Tax=Maioricimonas sp. JC845 TaxID=3232138 RepID=UPI00345977C6
MSGQQTGVLTRRGALTWYLDDLDLTRTELAAQVGVSVRTIHNIEHGRTRVSRQVLERVARALNERAALLYPADQPRGLTAAHFADTHEAAARLFLESVATNRPDILFTGDDPAASSEVFWAISGQPERIAFAGDYRGFDLGRAIERIHRTIHIEAIEDCRILQDRKSSRITLRCVLATRHPESGVIASFGGYSEIHFANRQITRVESMYDTASFAEFLATGAVDRQRRRDRLANW